LTIRSNTCGGGPSTDSKVTVGPSLLAIANELLAATPPAQPPRPQAIASSVAAATARATRWLAAWNKIAGVSLITP